MLKCNLSDEEIVLRIKDGEKSLFECIIDRYDCKLRRYAFRITKNDELLDDIMQNVYVKVFKSLHTFNPEYKFNSWIYRITHNESVSLSFKETYRNINCISIDNKEEGKSVVQIECTEKNPHEKMRHDELGGNIEFALSMIRKDYAEILKEFYFNDQSYKEIADKMDISINTVGTFLSRARHELSKFQIIK